MPGRGRQSSRPPGWSREPTTLEERALEWALNAPVLEQAPVFTLWAPRAERALWAPGLERALERTLWAPGLGRAL